MTRTYLDHASTAPLRPGVLDAMLPYFDTAFADPSRVHTDAGATRVAIEVAREQVASFVGARPREVIFTSGGTEAIAQAHHWVRKHAVTTSVEHSAVLSQLERCAAEITTLPVDATGRIDAADVAAAIGPSTELVSIQLANHEVGTCQPTPLAVPPGVRTHVDACAAIGHLPISFADLSVDLMSITAHKLGGPKGVGALIVRRGFRVPSLLVGGAQERARRAGLENVPAIVGFGAAVADLDVVAEGARQRTLIAKAARSVGQVAGVTRYGRADLPNLLCIGVEGVEAEPILLALDQAGIAAHSGSACSSESLEPSPVLAAMGVDAQHALRISVGWSTTDADIDRFGAAFADVVARLRALRG